jgi:hypothetical protein
MHVETVGSLECTFISTYNGDKCTKRTKERLKGVRNENTKGTVSLEFQQAFYTNLKATLYCNVISDYTLSILCMAI